MGTGGASKSNDCSIVIERHRSEVNVLRTIIRLNKNELREPWREIGHRFFELTTKEP